MKSAGAAVTRVRDDLSWPFSARPQAMTFYARFYERGTAQLANFNAILQITNAAAANPKIAILTNASGYYYIAFANDSGTEKVSEMAAAPSLGDLVELRATLADTGAVQIHQMLNGVSETSAAASAGQMLPQTWAGQTLYVNSWGNATFHGFVGLTHLVIARGVQTMATMRRLAGV
jgi:hypothetical protein